MSSTMSVRFHPLPCLFMMILLVSFCDAGTHQKCASNETTNQFFHGRFFIGTTINTTIGVTHVAAPHIFSCRDFCREAQSQCVGLAFTTSPRAAELPCRLYSGTSLHKLLVPDINSSSILILEKHCKPSSVVNGAWSSWRDSPSCPSPCRRVIVRQRRWCNNPLRQCNGDRCKGKNQQFRSCNAGECLELSRGMRFSSDGYHFMNIASRRVSVKFSGSFLNIQARINGSINFTRNWNEYKYGFGDVDGEFWLGNEHIHELTKASDTTLRIQLEDGAESVTLKYQGFIVGNQASGYQLQYGRHIDGDDAAVVGDSLQCQRNMHFSTYDRDNDRRPSTNCAAAYKSGWWFNSCACTNLNGEYQHNASPFERQRGIIWFGWKDDKFLTGSTMGVVFAAPMIQIQEPYDHSFEPAVAPIPSF